MRQPRQSPSTGESTKDQEKQKPARTDAAADTAAEVTEKPDVSRSGASAHQQQSGRADKGQKGPKSGGMGPKQ